MKRASSALNKERPMKARQRIGMATALVAFFAVMGMAQPEEGPVDFLDPAELSQNTQVPNTWANYKCTNVANCPSGLLRTLDFSYAGCSKVPFLDACIGSCKECTGTTSGNGGYICTPKQGSNCEFQTLPGTAIPCGTTNYYDCYFSSTAPGGVTATPNNCYCDSEKNASQDACSVNSCLGLGS
jgi:hypothetical protein